MNCKTLGILSSIALAIAMPATVHAQRGGRAGGHGSFGGGARMSGSASRPAGGGHFAGRAAGSNHAGRNSNHNGGNWNHNGGNWNHHNGGNWSHNGNRYCRYPRYYGGFGYPYYGYGFGYPFGYGYGFGYGYPYYGVSATFYAEGNRSYSRDGYQAGNGSVAARVQQRLARDGYYRGAIDGVVGNGTRSAIRAYERAKGLPVDGQIDSDLLNRMGLS